MSSQILVQTIATGSLIVAGQGLSVLSSVLNTHIAKNTEKYLLTAFIAVNCFGFFVEYYNYADGSLPEYISQFGGVIYLEGPLFYLYACALVTDDFRLNRRHLLHLWPLLMNPLIRHVDQVYMPGVHIHGFYIYYLFLIGYQVAALCLYPGAVSSLRKLLSFRRHGQYGWFWKLGMLYLASSIIFLAEKMVSYCVLSCPDRSDVVYIPNTFFFIIGFYLIARAYRTYPFRNGTVTSDDTATADGQVVAVDADLPVRKYQLAELDSDESRLLQQRLDTYMREHEPFLDDSLTAAKLARGLGISSHRLSQLLNTRLQQSFYDYVNGYRAEKARQLLQQYPGMAMVDIGAMAGFANRTTFYKYFKKRHSATPLQYRKSLTA